ncbi:hypothetical protein DAPPUDRAFT_106994 [Daphnia pulex]|uniref:C1q domain-containing protein n=1 Tax=Daphnia pulex TaxID=6669 RepID=E9GVL7_DAPPU|nr:hypothetical protein DAPPUDRAFT_106994 [Daphnia pulex]|eukprot:EFX76505.1 hypothetical protein DAPPUDRAFT_106994 [Daphnia pulex]
MLSVSCRQLLATIPPNSRNPLYLQHFTFPVIPAASAAVATQVHYAFPHQMLHPASAALIPGSSPASAPCQRELKYATQRLDETILTLQTVQNDMEESRKDLADTKATVGNLTAELRASTSPSSIGRLPSSCADLQVTGYKRSGLFSILGNNNRSSSIDSVYCDFTKSPNDTEFQVLMGSIDVKSRPTYFYVQKNNSFSSMGVPIPFEMARVNSGDDAIRDFDLANGTFTAPRSGTYYFAFTGLAEFPASVQFVYLEVRLLVNGLGVGTAHSSKSSATEYQFNQLALQSTLLLREGDRICLQITGMSDGVFLYDAPDIHHTHFSGFLLEEDFS